MTIVPYQTVLFGDSNALVDDLGWNQELRGGDSDDNRVDHHEYVDRPDSGWIHDLVLRLRRRLGAVKAVQREVEEAGHTEGALGQELSSAPSLCNRLLTYDRNGLSRRAEDTIPGDVMGRTAL